jgi:serine/threonine protein kinase
MARILVKNTAPTKIGKYDLVGKIGSGGMGTVYKGRDGDTGDVVAVKILDVKLHENPELHFRFATEFRAAAKLEHPNIVRAIEFNTDGETSYLVSEFVEGIDLGITIDQRGRLPEDEAVRIITQAAQALHYAHQGRVIHRDVKPDNILIRADGMVKLADFGLAKDFDDDRDLTKPARGLGTPHFMAPEQYTDAKRVGAACDIYSLGATLYNAVTGEMPFANSNSVHALAKKVKGDIPSPRELAPHVSERVDAAVRKAMHPDPAKRPATCLEFTKMLIVPTRGVPRPQPAATPMPRGAERRASARFERNRGSRALVDTGVHPGSGYTEAWPLMIRDVSAGGVGLLLARRFEVGTEMSIEVGTGPRPQSLPVRVVRVAPEGMGHWFHGCAFDPPLTAAQLGLLAEESGTMARSS